MNLLPVVSFLFSSSEANLVLKFSSVSIRRLSFSICLMFFELLHLSLLIGLKSKLSVSFSSGCLGSKWNVSKSAWLPIHFETLWLSLVTLRLNSDSLSSTRDCSSASSDGCSMRKSFKSSKSKGTSSWEEITIYAEIIYTERGICWNISFITQPDTPPYAMLAILYDGRNM